MFVTNAIYGKITVYGTALPNIAYPLFFIFLIPYLFAKPLMHFSGWYCSAFYSRNQRFLTQQFWPICLMLETCLSSEHSCPLEPQLHLIKFPLDQRQDNLLDQVNFLGATREERRKLCSTGRIHNSVMQTALPQPFLYTQVWNWMLFQIVLLHKEEALNLYIDSALFCSRWPGICWWSETHIKMWF